MQNNSTLDTLIEKPLNAKYYAFDDQDVVVNPSQKLTLIGKLSNMVVYILSYISKPYHRL
jgi:hypothetical protein